MTETKPRGAGRTARRRALGPKADRHSPDARAIEEAVDTATSISDPALLAAIARPYEADEFCERVKETQRIVLEASGPEDCALRRLIADGQWLAHYALALEAYAVRTEITDQRYWYSDRYVINTGIVVRPDAKLPFAVTGGILKRSVEALRGALRDCPSAVYPSLLACVLAHQRLQAEVEAADRRSAVARKGGVGKDEADSVYRPIRAELETWARGHPEWESAKAKLRANPSAHLPKKLLEEARAYVRQCADKRGLKIPVGGRYGDDLASRWLRAFIKVRLDDSR
jgi:hypothetical protein